MTAVADVVARTDDRLGQYLGDLRARLRIGLTMPTCEAWTYLRAAYVAGYYDALEDPDPLDVDQARTLARITELLLP